MSEEKESKINPGLLIGLAVASVLMVACALWHDTLNTYLNDGACTSSQNDTQG